MVLFFVGRVTRPSLALALVLVSGVPVHPCARSQVPSSDACQLRMHWSNRGYVLQVVLTLRHVKPNIAAISTPMCLN